MKNMENASKALIIAGAILLSILIIAIGIYIFNNAQSTIESSMTSMSTQEKEAFNSMFTIYEGKQEGTKVKALIKRLIANFDTYKDEPDNCPGLQGPSEESGGPAAGYEIIYYSDVEFPDEYIDGLNVWYKWVENKHTYTVTTKYNNKGLVDTIQIDL